MTIPTKPCRECRRALDVSQFYRERRGRFGVGTICKRCSREKVMQWRKDKPEQHQANHRRHCAAYRGEALHG